MGVSTAMSRGLVAVKSSVALSPPATWPSRPSCGSRGSGPIKLQSHHLSSCEAVAEGLGAKCAPLPARRCSGSGGAWTRRDRDPVQDAGHVRHYQQTGYRDVRGSSSSSVSSAACCRDGRGTRQPDSAPSGQLSQSGNGRGGGRGSCANGALTLARARGDRRNAGGKAERVVAHALPDSDTADEAAKGTSVQLSDVASRESAELANEGDGEEGLQAMEVLRPERIGDAQSLSSLPSSPLSFPPSSGLLSKGQIESFLYPDKEELPDDVEMSIWDHLEELRQRVFFSAGAVGACMVVCFSFVKDLVRILEAPVYSQGVRFLQLSPGEYFFTTLKVAGYAGLLLGSPVILYEIIAFVVPGLTRSERRFLGPIVFGSSILFYVGLLFSYAVLTPAALNFFVNYSEGVVESIWSIDQYFEFVLVLMFSTGLAFQVPVIQLLLGQTGLVTGEQMLAVWKYVVVGAVTAAAVLTPSTDPLTQLLLAGPLMGLYLGGAAMVKALEKNKNEVT